MSSTGITTDHTDTDHPQLVAATILDRFHRAFPKRLGPQTSIRILQVVNRVPCPPIGQGIKTRRDDLAALAFFLHTAGSTTAEGLAGIFNLGAPRVCEMIRQGRTVVGEHEAGTLATPRRRETPRRGLIERNAPAA